MERQEIADLYEPLAPIIFRRCLRMLANVEDARDATQEVFVEMMRYADRIDGPEGAVPWAYRVSTSTCLKRIRKQRRVQIRAPEAMPDPGRSDRMEERLLAREALETALARVDERGQRVFVYAFVDGLPQEQISELMGLSRRTVGKRIKAIRALLAATTGLGGGV